MRATLIAVGTLGLALTATSSNLGAQSLAEKAGWRATGSVGFLGGAVGDWYAPERFSTGNAVDLEIAASRRLRPGLTFDAAAMMFYSYEHANDICLSSCARDVHLLGAFGTARQKIPMSASGWGVFFELGGGAVQLRTARRNPGEEMIAADGPALNGGVGLTTRSFWHVAPTVRYREFAILRPDASVLRFQSVALQLTSR